MTAHSIAGSVARYRVTRGARFRGTEIDPANPWRASSLKDPSTPFGRSTRNSPTADSKVKAELVKVRTALETDMPAGKATARAPRK